MVLDKMLKTISVLATLLSTTISPVNNTRQPKEKSEWLGKEGEQVRDPRTKGTMQQQQGISRLPYPTAEGGPGQIFPKPQTSNRRQPRKAHPSYDGMGVLLTTPGQLGAPTRRIG